MFFIFFSYLMNLAFQDVFEGWRYMFAFTIFPSVWILYLSKFVIPESPRWLVLQGRESEAKPLLAEFLGKDKGKNLHDIQNTGFSQGEMVFRCIDMH